MLISSDFKGFPNMLPKQRGRYAFDLAYLDTSRSPVKGHPTASDAPVGTIMATDGKRLVLLPVNDVSDDVSGFLTVDALKAAFKGKGVGVGKTVASIHANGALEVRGSATFPRPGSDAGELPVSSMFEIADKLPDVGAEGTVNLTLDVDLLQGLVEAMKQGDRVATLTFKARKCAGGGESSTQDPIRVSFYGRSDAVGVLMPCQPDSGSLPHVDPD